MLLQVYVLEPLTVIKFPEECRLISQNQQVELLELVPSERFSGSGGVGALLNVVDLEIVVQDKKAQVQIEIEEDGSNFVVLDCIYKHK